MQRLFYYVKNNNHREEQNMVTLHMKMTLKTQ